MKEREPGSVPSVRPARTGDRAAFLTWAAEVEPLFGPMVGVPQFEDALDSAIRRGTALVAVHPRTGEPSGGLLFSHEPREIGWLAVAGEARGRGAGLVLLAVALAELGPGPVRVETFAASVPEGGPARRLYERFAFTPTGEHGLTPARIPTEVLERP